LLILAKDQVFVHNCVLSGKLYLSDTINSHLILLKYQFCFAMVHLAGRGVARPSLIAPFNCAPGSLMGRRGGRDLGTAGDADTTLDGRGVT
jgi:hypothetical protein